MRGAVALALLVLGLSGCPGPSGYETAEHLEQRAQGPSGCVTRCQELGLEMTALVLVEAHMSGCVCQPVRTSGDATPISGAVAGEAVLEIARRRAAAAAAAARRVAAAH